MKVDGSGFKREKEESNLRGCRWLSEEACCKGEQINGPIEREKHYHVSFI